MASRNSSRACLLRNTMYSHLIVIPYQVGTLQNFTADANVNNTGSQPPSLLVTVSGNVLHGRGPAGNPVATPAKSVDGQSRVFSQTFMLVPDPTAPPTKTGEVAKYYVNADAMRFVG